MSCCCFDDSCCAYNIAKLEDCSLLNLIGINYFIAVSVYV